jgi:hypothetical protein
MKLIKAGDFVWIPQGTAYYSYEDNVLELEGVFKERIRGIVVEKIQNKRSKEVWYSRIFIDNVGEKFLYEDDVYLMDTEKDNVHKC